VGARLIATRPEDGGTAPPGAALVAVLALEGEWSAEGLRVRLDGADVTARCQIRTDRAWPPRRAEIVLTAVSGGEHRAELEWPGSAPHVWRFTVARDSAAS
jgi:hypothetical protein